MSDYPTALYILNFQDIPFVQLMLHQVDAWIMQHGPLSLNLTSPSLIKSTGNLSITVMPSPLTNDL